MEAIRQFNLRLVDRHWFYRLLEMVPGVATWLFLLSPVILSVFSPLVVAYFIIAFDLFWLIKSFRLSTNLLRGYSRLYENQQVDWAERLRDLQDLPGAVRRYEASLKGILEQHPNAASRLNFGSARNDYLKRLARYKELSELADRKQAVIDPRELYNVVIIATYNESREILEPTIKALLDSDYDPKRLMLVLAYEERGGEKKAKESIELIEEYGPQFAYAVAIKHPDGLPGEAKVKGANMSYAGRRLTEYITEQQIDPENVIVTTLDSDNRPSPNYFSYLSYAYATNVNRVRKSYQPIPMFLNNIWDVPAPMRIVATGNSFWMIMEAMRPHRLRNFAAHAQSLKALIETDYWSVTSIVEDGHQFWRTYFTYDGDHEVVPLFTPVYQDAVLAKGYFKTFRAQYVQLRRWAWGASEFAFVVKNSITNKRIGRLDKLAQIWRLFEGHFSWATSPLILTFVAWLPLYLNRNFASEDILAHQLPIIVSRILTITMMGLLITIFISLLSLPPKPPRYHRARFITMVLQWALVPVVAILFGAFAAIDAQTRLMFGRYLDWRVTEKVTKL